MTKDHQEAIATQLRVYATILRQWAGRPDLTAGDLRDIAEGLERQAEGLGEAPTPLDDTLGAQAEKLIAEGEAVFRDLGIPVELAVLAEKFARQELTIRALQRGESEENSERNAFEKQLVDLAELVEIVLDNIADVLDHGNVAKHIQTLVKNQDCDLQPILEQILRSRDRGSYCSGWQDRKEDIGRRNGMAWPSP